MGYSSSVYALPASFLLVACVGGPDSKTESTAPDETAADSGDTQETADTHETGDTAETGDTGDTVDTSPPPAFTVDVFSDGLPAGTYRGLSVAPDGMVWGATTVGLVALDPSTGAARTYTSADNMIDDAPLSVLAASDGTLWVGHAADTTQQGEQLFVEDDGSLSLMQPVAFAGAMEETTLYRLREQPYGDGVGDIWMGANEGLVVFDVSARAFYDHSHPTHPHGASMGVAFSSDDNEWNLDEYQLSRWDYQNDGSMFSPLVEYWVPWPVEVGATIAGTDADYGDGVVWITSSLYGVGKVTVGADAGTSTTELFVDPASANAVRVDEAGLVWVGAADGLWIWDGAAFTPVVDPALPDGAVDQLAVGGGAVWAAIGAQVVRITGDPRGGP